MADKTEQIIEGAMKVFVEKGYLQATTQEIAKEAQVAEITLYRKFSTKQNLFKTVVTKVLEERFQAKAAKLAKEQSTKEFFKNILQDRLDTISKNGPLVRMLIAESLMGNLEDEANFINMIFGRLKEVVQSHFKHTNQDLDPEFYARYLVNILLGYAVLPREIPFHKLSQQDQDKLTNQYVDCLGL